MAQGGSVKRSLAMGLNVYLKANGSAETPDRDSVTPAKAGVQELVELGRMPAREDIRRHDLNRRRTLPCLCQSCTIAPSAFEDAVHREALSPGGCPMDS